MNGRILGAVLLCGILQSSGSAQKTQSGGSTSTSGSNPSLGPAGTSDVGKFSNWDKLGEKARSGDYLSGDVSVGGGPLPWDPIAVSVICDGKTSFTVNTDPKGRFVITSQHAASYTTGSAADPHAKLVSQYVGCDVHAALAGFDSSVVKITDRSVLDDPNIGTVKLTREQGAAGGAVSSTTDAAPKDAAKAFEKARTEWLDMKPDAAERDLEKAVKAYPQFAEAWYELGRLQEHSKSQEAWDSYSKAVEADPKFVLPFERLAELAAVSGKWDDAVKDSSHAIELDPHGSPHLWYYNALGNFKQNKLDEAEASCNKALAMDPLHVEPNTEQLLAVILAAKGDVAGALQHLRNCLTYLPSGPNADLVKQQVAQLEKAAPTAK